MSIKETAVTRIAEAGGRLRVKSALNPVLWLCLIVTFPSITCFPFLSQPPVWLIVLAFLPLITAIFGFIYLLLKDPDKLQSEDYQLRKRELEIIEEKGRPSVPASSLPVITEDQANLLDNGSE